MSLPSDPTPIEPEPAPIQPDVPGGPSEPIDGVPDADADEAEVLRILEDDLPGQPSFS
jgi:hypothetical protein